MTNTVDEFREYCELSRRWRFVRRLARRRGEHGGPDRQHDKKTRSLTQQRALHTTATSQPKLCGSSSFLIPSSRSHHGDERGDAEERGLDMHPRCA